MNTQKLINTMEDDVAKAIESVSFKILAGVVKKTPVISGDAQNSWNISEGKINTSIKSKVRIPGNKISGKKDVYITNSIHYISDLERGSSKQAPKGMVALTVNELKSL